MDDNKIELENNISIQLRIVRGMVLKSDLCKAVDATSLHVLRNDLKALCEKNDKARDLYKDYQKNTHFLPLDLAKMLIQNLYYECKIILVK